MVFLERPVQLVRSDLRARMASRDCRVQRAKMAFLARLVQLVRWDLRARTASLDCLDQQVRQAKTASQDGQVQRV
jgi:hypothetical protein